MNKLKNNMKLKVIVLVLTLLIYIIRIFWKESTDLFDKNFDYLLGINLDRVVIYIYQIIVFLLIVSVKKINVIIVIILLFINLFLITCYLYPLDNVFRVSDGNF